MRTFVALGIGLVWVSRASAADTPEGLDFFEKKIQPVLVEHCYGCHSAAAMFPMGGLMLDSAPGIRRVITPGAPEKSLLIAAIRREGKLQMLPGSTLAAEHVADFEAWIKMGAPDPRGASAAGSAGCGPAPHWSFQPVKDVAASKIADPAWNQTAIDRFVKAKLEEKKLTPLGVASKSVLIRRATFDLTGLPSTPEEVTAFLADTSTDAFDKLVERLLATQQYEERWGRHGLDLVRYADTSGCNSDYPVPDAYRYRNWVIRAFNEDKPYDQFLREQIAGDLLPARIDSSGEENTEDRYAKIVATGYLAIARRFGSHNNEFHLTIEDTIDNVGKTMLGLSVACARCHHHKVDPISQRDYYALYGIVESTRYPFPSTEIYQHAKDFVALAPKKAADRLKAYQDETSQLDDRLQAFADSREGKDLSAEEKAKEVQRMKDRISVLENRAPVVPKAYAVSEGTPVNTSIQLKGDPKNPGEEEPRGFLDILGGQTVPREEKGSGRRELADSITDPGNPLMARVTNSENSWYFRVAGQGVKEAMGVWGYPKFMRRDRNFYEYLTANGKKELRGLDANITNPQAAYRRLEKSMADKWFRGVRWNNYAVFVRDTIRTGGGKVEMLLNCPDKEFAEKAQKVIDDALEGIVESLPYGTRPF